MRHGRSVALQDAFFLRPWWDYTSQRELTSPQSHDYGPVGHSRCGRIRSAHGIWSRRGRIAKVRQEAIDSGTLFCRCWSHRSAARGRASFKSCCFLEFTTATRGNFLRACSTPSFRDLVLLSFFTSCPGNNALLPRRGLCWPAEPGYTRLHFVFDSGKLIPRPKIGWHGWRSSTHDDLARLARPASPRDLS